MTWDSTSTDWQLRVIGLIENVRKANARRDAAVKRHEAAELAEREASDALAGALSDVLTTETALLAALGEN